MSLQSNFKTLPISARWIIVMVGTAGLAVLLYAIVGQSVLRPGMLIMLLPLAAVSARAKVILYRGSSISFLTTVVLIAAIREGAFVAMLVGVCGVTVQTMFPARRFAFYQVVFNAGMILLTVAAAFSTYHLLEGTQAIETISPQVTAAILASFVYFLANSTLVSLIVALTKGGSMFDIWTNYFMRSGPSFIMAGLLSVCVIGLTASHFLLLGGAVVAVLFFVYYCAVRFSGQVHAQISSPGDMNTAA